MRMHDAYLTAAAAGLLDVVALGAPEEDPQALKGNDVISATIRSRTLGLVPDTVTR